MKKFSICKCLYSKNIFLKDLNIHVEYHNRKEFLKAYTQIFSDYNVLTEEDKKKVLDENIKLELRDVMLFIRLYLDGLSLIKISHQVGINYTSTAVSWGSMVREIMVDKVYKTLQTMTLTGDVEIDESLFGRKFKHHRGAPKGTRVWIFGMVERESQKLILYPVKDRSRETLIPIIQKHVSPGSRIFSDGWSSYLTLNDLGYEHFVVNHKFSFIQIYENVVTGEKIKANTNMIEGAWKHAKAHFKDMNGVRGIDNFESHLCEVIYRQLYRGEYLMSAFLSDIRNVYTLAAKPLYTYRKPIFPTLCDVQEYAQIEREVARRRSLAQASQERRLLIEKQYQRKHPDLFQLKREFLAPEFTQLVDYCNSTDANFEELFAETSMRETNISRAYTIPVFTADFCARFLEEIQNFEDSDCPKGRPNTMNNYGVLLDELGFNDFISDFRENYLCPLSKILFPDWGGADLDSHKAFTVQYKVNEDRDLSFHFDNAEVTLNVALSPKESYSGGKLYFGVMRTEVHNGNYDEFEHKPTVGLIHRGQHKHGARPISGGARYNLIIWMRSSKVRNRKCPMCDLVPDLEETVGFGGGFIKPEPATVDVCTLN